VEDTVTHTRAVAAPRHLDVHVAHPAIPPCGGLPDLVHDRPTEDSVCSTDVWTGFGGCYHRQLFSVALSGQLPQHFFAFFPSANRGQQQCSIVPGEGAFFLWEVFKMFLRKYQTGCVGSYSKLI